MDRSFDQDERDELAKMGLIPLMKAVKMCGLKTDSLLRRAIRDGEIPAYKLAHRTIVIEKPALIRWLKEHRMNDWSEEDFE
jgi:hypothetical protein